MKLRFGDRVAELVAQESEDKTLSWKERKSATIARLKDAQREVQLIGLADKALKYAGYRQRLSGCRREVMERFG